ncbi:MAG: cupredoxin domain-containing protein [Dongiaceae bacterium]
MRSQILSPIIGLALGALALGMITGDRAVAQDSHVLTIKDHKFEPAELTVPAGSEFTLVVKNLDATPEEFESETLDLEKVIPGGEEAEFTVGPLEAGEYEFFGEFNMDTALGKIIVN